MFQGCLRFDLASIDIAPLSGPGIITPMKGHSLRRVSFVLGFIPIKLKKALLCILLGILALLPQGAMAGDTLARLLKHEAHAPRASGELLLQELSCLACHQVSAPWKTHLSPKLGPILGEQGLPLTPQFIRQRLLEPDQDGQGRTMPDVLHAYETDEKEAIVDALTHYLISAQTPLDSEPVAADASTILRGRNLYHAVGCVACHGAHSHPEDLKGSDIPAPGSLLEVHATSSDLQPLPSMDSKTTVDALARYLRDPKAIFPNAHMPSMKLTSAECRAIAMYLLRGQAAGMFGAEQSAEKTRGLKYHYLEFGSPSREAGDIVSDLKEHFPGDNPPDFTDPLANGIAEEITDQWKKRQDNMALIFSGFIRIQKAGEYAFYTASDDGSRLYIGSKLIVQNDGDHATVEKSGRMSLSPGDHPIKITYYNRGGPAELRVFMEGPGMTKQPIPGEWLYHLGQPMSPTQTMEFTLDQTKASQGKAWFQKLGCASCHAMGQVELATASQLTRTGTPWQERGCLSAEPGEDQPRYSISEKEKSLISQVLDQLSDDPEKRSPTEQLTKLWVQQQCQACHSRDGLGGPEPSTRPFFTSVGEVDMGDEGSVPPALTGVGRKLLPEWVTTVITDGASVRPYMATRMPAFGETIGHAMAASMLSVDQAAPSDAAETQPVSLDEAKFGRKLVGTGGMGCITCHTFGKYPSLGIPALDLTLMSQRLQKEWFTSYLKDPQGLRPGTRMPSFWPEGQSVNQDIFEGDTNRQIDAIWAYLKLADDTNPPDGLVQGQKEILVQGEAVMYRNFIEGAGSRAIGVGYPEKANLAFDAHAMRAAMIWQGPFMDGARHSNGRGQGFEPPLGHNLFLLPSGPPFAFSVAPAEMLWPELTGKEAGYTFKGYWLDSQRRPKFMYRFLAMDVEDYWVDVPGELDASFRRYLTFDSKAHYTHLWMRAAIGSNISTMDDGAYLIDEKVIMRFEWEGDRKAVIQSSDQGSMLLIPVELNHGKARVIQEILW